MWYLGKVESILSGDHIGLYWRICGAERLGHGQSDKVSILVVDLY